MRKTGLGWQGQDWDEKDMVGMRRRSWDEKKDKVGWDGEGLDENVLTTMRGNM